MHTAVAVTIPQAIQSSEQHRSLLVIEQRAFDVQRAVVLLADQSAENGRVTVSCRQRDFSIERILIVP